MPNRFFEEEDVRPDPETGWRGRVVDELRKRNVFPDLHIAAVYSTPEVYLYHRDHFRPYGAKLVLQMGRDGLSVGFYIERGYLWAAEAGWTLQPHWDWHHFLYLLGNDPKFQLLFQQARELRGAFSFWIQTSDSDKEELSFFASHLPFATIHGLLASWPGHLWCDVYFSHHLSTATLLKAPDEALMEELIAAIGAVEPIYRAVLGRKLEIDARASAFGA